MYTTRIVVSLALSLTFTALQAQFPNVLVNQKPRPLVTKSEMEGDSVNYIDKPNNFKDRRGGVIHSVWTEFDKYKSKNRADSSVIMYSRADVSGKNRIPPIRISTVAGDCNNSDSTLKADVPCAGPGNDLYVCWAAASGVYFQRSSDLGATWLERERFVTPMKNGWDQQVNQMRVACLPRMACVVDSNEHKGRIYICWSDEKNGVNNKDVFLVYSDDKGESWTEPILVTYRPNHKDQFNPLINIQPATGAVYLTYFDKQNYVGGMFYDLYLAVSNNGGLKFDYYRINEKPIFPDSVISSARGLAFLPKAKDARVIWSQIDEKNMLNIYSAMITDSTMTAYLEKEKKEELVIERTFAYGKKIPISFTTPVGGYLTATITKPLEPGNEIIVLKEQVVAPGPFSFVVDAKKMGLPKGNYILNLYFNHRHTFVWVMGE